VFVPINKDLHWSLCVVVNPGEIAKMFVTCSDEIEHPWYVMYQVYIGLFYGEALTLSKHAISRFSEDAQ